MAARRRLIDQIRHVSRLVLDVEAQGAHERHPVPRREDQTLELVVALEVDDDRRAATPDQDEIGASR